MQPGASIPFTVVFDGPYTSKLNSGRLNVQLKSSPKADQEGFKADLWTGQSPIRNGVLEVSLAIPDQLADGQYAVSLIEVFAFGTISKTYQSSEFSAPPSFSVCNQAKFKWPTVKTVTGK